MFGRAEELAKKILAMSRISADVERRCALEQKQMAELKKEGLRLQ